MRVFFLLISCLLFLTYSDAQLQRFSFTEPKMGSPFTIILYAADTLTAAAASNSCFNLVDSLVNIFSDYIDSSELNRLTASGGSGQPFACSAPLFDLLMQSQDAFNKSTGSFDITLGPVTHLWRKARKENVFPDSATVHEKLQHTGFRKLKIDTIHHTVTVLQAGMQLDAGGIGQGYIAQQVIHHLKKLQIANALVDVSGDIVTTGKPPGTLGWTIAINLPESRYDLLPTQLLITDKAVTTSGDVYQFMEHHGKRYSHIVNPTTGYGITSQRNVTVIAADGTTADWLTKACSILPIAKALQLATRLQAEVLIATLKNDKLVFYRSKGFNKYWKKKM